MRRCRGVLSPLALLATTACSPGAALNDKLPAPAQPATAAAQKAYQPLAKGDSWTYTCNDQFVIENRVVGSYHVGEQPVFALSLQIPSSPSKSVRVVQLLANDAKGNTWIYGYLIGGKVHAVRRAEIVAASPVKEKHYDYPGEKGGTITRIFKLFEDTNRTPLGVFWVAAYFESNNTHNYGYSLGRGVMEEDHGPNYRYDCLIEKYVVH